MQRVYGVAYLLATILTFVISAIHTSYVPWMFEKIEQKKVDDNRRVSLLLAGIAFMLLGVIALAPEIVYIICGQGVYRCYMGGSTRSNE